MQAKYIYLAVNFQSKRLIQYRKTGHFFGGLFFLCFMKGNQQSIVSGSVFIVIANGVPQKHSGVARAQRFYDDGEYLCAP